MVTNIYVRIVKKKFQMETIEETTEEGRCLRTMFMTVRLFTSAYQPITIEGQIISWVSLNFHIIYGLIILFSRVFFFSSIQKSSIILIKLIINAFFSSKYLSFLIFEYLIFNNNFKYIIFQVFKYLKLY